MRRFLAVAVAAATVSLPLTVVGATPAGATPCDHSVRHAMKKGRVFVEKRVNGDHPVYNKTADPVTKSVSFGKSVTNSVNKHWELGASAGVGWGPVKADISAKYGKSYTRAATRSASDSITMTIRPKHTGWVRAIYYTKVIFWTAKTERWNKKKQKCVSKNIAKAFWGAPKIELVPVTKKGHHYPARPVVR